MGGWGVDVGGKWQAEPTQDYLCGRNPALLLLPPTCEHSHPLSSLRLHHKSTFGLESRLSQLTE